jgi:predicted Zn finger-like uncharacterized protein
VCRQSLVVVFLAWLKAPRLSSTLFVLRTERSFGASAEIPAMLIRCTHCHHELRVPEHQISPSGTRVLCRSCNTIFVARRPTDESRAGKGRGNSDPEVLPVAEDPALEAALDRVLDRTPMPGTLGAATSASPPWESTGSAQNHGEDGATDRPSLTSASSWGDSSPEALGISLVEDDGGYTPPPSPTPTASAEPGHRASSSTGSTGDDVDELLDQVLRDLDTTGSELRIEPDERFHGDPSDQLLDDLGLGNGSTGARPNSESTRSSAPYAGGGPSPTTEASGLDLEAILSELDAEPEPELENRDERFGSAFDDPEAVTITIGLANEGKRGSSPAEGPRASAPASDEAHEREQSLEEIYADGHGAPLTEELEAPPPAPGTNLAYADPGAPSEPARQPASPSRIAEARPRRTASSKPAATPARRSPAVFVVAALVLAAAASGLWFLRAQGMLTSEKPDATQLGPKGLPTFAFEDQDGEIVKLKNSLAFTVHGQVRNTSHFPVYVIKVSGILRAGGHEVARAWSYAGNSVSSASLSKVARSEVEETLRTKLGEGGTNVKIEAGAALPFTLVFYDVTSDVSAPELSATARTFPPPSGNAE